eukprot:1154605-Pelagomonas_calceolata.AAC.10
MNRNISSSEDNHPAKTPKGTPISLVPLPESGGFQDVGPNRLQWLASCHAAGPQAKEQLAKAHRSGSVMSHIYTKSY